MLIKWSSLISPVFFLPQNWPFLAEKRTKETGKNVKKRASFPKIGSFSIYHSVLFWKSTCYLEDYHISREIYFLSKQEKRLIMFSFIQQNQTEWEFVKIEKNNQRNQFLQNLVFFQPNLVITNCSGSLKFVRYNGVVPQMIFLELKINSYIRQSGAQI